MLYLEDSRNEETRLKKAFILKRGQEACFSVVFVIFCCGSAARGADRCARASAGERDRGAPLLCLRHLMIERGAVTSGADAARTAQSVQKQA